MSTNVRAIQRIRAGFREIAQALDDLLTQDDWIDQRSSPLGRRAHCEACRSGALPARKVRGRWLARRADVDAYIEQRGSKPPGERAGVDDETAIAQILAFRAPKRRKRQGGA